MILTRQTYSARLEADDPVVRDHRVHGAPILPGVVFLDLILRMARAAGLDPDRLALRKVLFEHPVSLQPGQTCGLRVVFEPARGFVAVTVSGRLEENAPWTVHLRAELHEAEPLPAGARPWSGLDETARPVADIYALARQAGIEHRDFMLPEGSVAVSGLEASARLRLSESARAHLPDFLLHPAMLDAATVLGAAPTLAAGGGGHAYIPFYIHEFRAAGPLPEECRVVLRARALGGDADLHTVDIDLYDEEGRHRASFRRLDAKRIRHPESLRLTTVSPAPALSPAGPAAAPASLTDYLRRVVAEQTGVAADGVPLTVGFYDQGLDSKNLLQIVQRLEGDLGRDFYPTLLFEHPTVAALAKHLGETCGDQLKFPAPAPARPDPTLPPLGTSRRALAPEDPRPAREASPLPGDAPRNSGAAEPIAVIGVAGRYPMAPDLDSLWENLRAGKDCVREVPPERWDWRLYHSPEKGTPGKAYSHWGSWLENHDCFDARLFHISPADAARMDPQERLFLECAWALLEDAGYPPRDFAGRHGGRVGVFAGAMWSEYQLFAGNDVANSWHASIANRVSYVFDFRGPSLAVDAMCATSLLAVHLACESLRRGECDAALAGGVNLSLHPQKYVQLSQMRMLSTDGRCRSFGQAGDGYVPGEGVGAVLLKPLAAARRDGDRIDGVILGSACNHGGATAGYTVPSSQAQAALLRQAWAAAGIDPRSLGYIEAHGTGTSLGDPIEVEGIAKAFRESGCDDACCAVGSIKSNLGHLESAAGIAALTKVLLQFRRGEMAPSIHADELNPKIDWDSAPVKVRREPAAWPATGEPRRAGVSSFGAGGTNVHLVVGEPPAPAETPTSDETSLVILSARDEPSLRSAAARLRAWLDRHPEAGLAEVAATLRTGREAMAQRLGFVAGSRSELCRRLEDFERGRLEEIHTARAGRAAAPAPEADAESLIRAWVAGAEVDWAAREPARIPPLSLPSYPFARERFWVGELSSQPAVAAAAPGLERLLADHLVAGTPVLPGAVFLSMALEEAAAVTALSWKRPAREAGVRMQKDGARLRLASLQGGAIFAEATVSARGAAPPSVDLEAVRRRCEQAGDGAAIYAGFARAGLVYGPALRGLAGWRAGQNEVLAELRPGIGSAATLDAALQTVAPLLPGDGKLRVPQGLARASRFHDLSGAAFVHARTVAAEAWDVAVLNADGESLAFLERLAFAAMEPASTLFCAPRWIPAPAKDGPIAAQAILLLDRDARRFAEWKQRGGAPRVILVRPGEGFERTAENQFVVRPAEPGDWRRLVEEIGYDPAQPLAVVHAWSEGDVFPPKISGAGRGEFDQQLDRGLLAVFRLAQALLARKPAAAARFVCLGDSPLGATVAGFGRALRLENPRFIVQTLRGGDPLVELARPEPAGGEIQYDGTTRLARRLSIVEAGTPPPSPGASGAAI